MSEIDFLDVSLDCDTNGLRVKFNLRWGVFLVVLPLGSTSAFGQAYPQLVCDSIAASKSICGFAEFPGHVSTPPRFYLVKTQTRHWSGTSDGAGCVGNDLSVNNLEVSYQKVSAYDPSSCEFTDCASSSGSGISTTIVITEPLTILAMQTSIAAT